MESKSNSKNFIHFLHSLQFLSFYFDLSKNYFENPEISVQQKEDLKNLILCRIMIVRVRKAQ